MDRGLTPLVGREQELATLRERFREVKAGRGQVVGIAGEAGIGKSRLALEFRRALASAGAAVTWLEGHCVSFGPAGPFLPLIEQLRENFQIDEFDGELEIIAKVEQGMRRMGEVEGHISAIRHLLSVDPGDAGLTAMEGAARWRHLFAAVRALSLRGARLRPLVLVVEDLYGIDTSSEEFLTFMLDAVAGVPLLLLVTYRIGYTPPFGNRSFYTTLTLHSFSEAETLARGEEAIQVAETVDQPFTLSHAYLGIGFFYLRKGDLQASIATLEKSLRVCETGDIQLLLPWAAAALGYAYALSGRLAEALPLLERAVEQSAAMHLMVHHPLWLVYLGEAYLPCASSVRLQRSASP